MSRTRTRKRPRPPLKLMTTSSGSYSTPRLTGSSTCVDVVHPGPPYKTGGPLNIASVRFEQSPSQRMEGSINNGLTWYDGKFWVNPVHTTDAVPTDIDLSAYGAQAFQRALPVHDLLNLGQFLVELRDIPEMLRSTKHFFSGFDSKEFVNRPAKFWADAHLASQFGWKPFLSDLFGILQFQRKLMARVDWLRKHDGKPIHRKFTVAHNVDESRISYQESTAPLQPVLQTGFYDTSQQYKGVIETFMRKEYNIWFSGCFTFHIPELHGVSGIDWRLKTKLLGLTPDLNLIYKVTPWTWLIDWFSSAGSVISNASLMAKYHQVAKYAYIMSHQRTSYVTYAYQYILNGPNVPKRNMTLVSANASTILERKQREVANPYGFGIRWDSLGSYQLSILAALGITRARGVL